MKRSIVCVYTDECQEAVVGTFYRPAFVSFFLNAARKVEVIACLCGTIPRLRIRDIKMPHCLMFLDTCTCCATLFWLRRQVVCVHGLHFRLSHVFSL